MLSVMACVKADEIYRKKKEEENEKENEEFQVKQQVAEIMEQVYEQNENINHFDLEGDIVIKGEEQNQEIQERDTQCEEAMEVEYQPIENMNEMQEPVHESESSFNQQSQTPYRSPVSKRKTLSFYEPDSDMEYFEPLSPPIEVIEIEDSSPGFKTCTNCGLNYKKRHQCKKKNKHKKHKQ